MTAAPSVTSLECLQRWARAHSCFHHIVRRELEGLPDEGASYRQLLLQVSQDLGLILMPNPRVVLEEESLVRGKNYFGNLLRMFHEKTDPKLILEDLIVMGKDYLGDLLRLYPEKTDLLLEGLQTLEILRVIGPTVLSEVTRLPDEPLTLILPEDRVPPKTSRILRLKPRRGV